MEFYIPEISDSIRLLEDWEFKLYNESRNDSLSKYLAIGFPNQGWAGAKDPPVPVIIPAGEILIIDRIYIRKGSSEFSSVTFRWKNKANPAYFEETQDYSKIMIDGVPVKYDWRLHQSLPRTIPVMRQSRVAKEPIRFWAKLEDVNKIHYEKA